MRPLGIPTLEDRIVQQALRMLMEPIFEADFYTCSHGFRRYRSTHTALRDVARMFPRTTWTIEGDIVGCFDNIPHGRLMKAVEQRIADEKVLKLIQRVSWRQDTWSNGSTTRRTVGRHKEGS